MVLMVRCVSVCFEKSSQRCLEKTRHVSVCLSMSRYSYVYKGFGLSSVCLFVEWKRSLVIVQSVLTATRASCSTCCLRRTEGARAVQSVNHRRWRRWCGEDHMEVWHHCLTVCRDGGTLSPPCLLRYEDKART